MADDLETRGPDAGADDAVRGAMRHGWMTAVAVLTLAGAGCSERTPTSLDRDLLPPLPVSVEVLIPWERFGSNLEVFGGYGTRRELGVGMVAHAFGGVLDARTLVSFEPIARFATVTDTTGTSRTDTILSVREGRVVVLLDAGSAVFEGPVGMELGILRKPWDPATVSWTMAADTAEASIPWDEPGAGPLERVATAVWDPAQGDTVVFALDSAQVEMWRDTANVNYGAVIGASTPGVRVEVTQALMRATVRPSVRPDTLLTLTGGRRTLAFIHTPEPAPASPGSLRVGGAPAWRTVLDMDVPASLDSPAVLCQATGCPMTLTPARVSYAALVLTARATEAAFRPSDSLMVDVRAVLQRSAMPKSPLGPSLSQGFGTLLDPLLFGEGEGGRVEIPITDFVRAILQGDSVGGFPPPRSLALLSALEPSSFTYASFQGPGTPGAPVLKLIVTAVPTVQLP